MTQQDVIKKFMASLDTTALSGTAAVDEAIRACSDFDSLQEVIDQMVSDCRAANNANNFLLNYCGINLNNDDTGAISGWDAGGSVVKNAEDIVPETGELINFTGNSFTVKGLTLRLDDNKSFSDLTDSQKFIWQGLYTWWVKGALDLIAESYGSNFGFDSNSSANNDTMYVEFAEDSENLAWVAGNRLGISNYYYGRNIDNVNPNGVSTTTKSYLDRILAHEFTHAAMFANIDNGNLPDFITEGMAELTHGINDKKSLSIRYLAASPSDLEKVLSKGSLLLDYEYVGGYMFLRYLAKQAADEDYSINNTLSAVTVTGTASDDRITNDNADNVTILSVAGNDRIYNSRGDSLFIDGGTGSDYIYSSNGYGVTIYGGEGDDTIKTANSGTSEIYSGAGNDSIIVEYGTIIGGTGNDTINGNSKTRVGRLYQYAAGDGSDVITGFNSFDTLQITDGTYTTAQSGSDLVVNVGSGKVTLKDIYLDEYRKVHIAASDGSVAVLNDWSIMSGTDGADNLYNVDNNVTILGLGGNDTIENYGSKVSISGGTGDDSIINDGDGNVDGGAGNDDISVKGYGNILGGAGDDTISSRGGKIDGGDGNDYIFSSVVGSNSYVEGGLGNDTLLVVTSAQLLIDGSAGNDVITCINDEFYQPMVTISGGIGNDTIEYDSLELSEHSIYKKNYRNLYQYAAGDGADVIEGFTKYDKLEITGGTYSTMVSGEDIIVKVGSGSITLKDAKDIEELNIDGEYAEEDTIPAGISIKGATLTASTAFIGTEINLADYDSTVTKVNASALSRGISIVGTAEANSLKGGKGDDTISGGAGNDTLTGGAGSDIFVYESGNDLIQDYAVGADKIKLSGTSITSASVSGSNLVFKTSAGNLTVKNGKNKKITVIDSRGTETTKIYPETSSDTLPAGLNYDSAKKVLTVSTSYSGAAIDLANFATTTKTVDASKFTKALKITGTTRAESLVGGSKADTLIGGKGNDTLKGNGGNDIFVYASGDGNDVIADFTIGDKISLSGGASVSSATLKNSDMIFKIGNGNITVKGGKDKEISIGSAIYYNNLIYDSKKTAATVGAGQTGTLKATDYATSVKKVDASKLTKTIGIVGNAQANTINGGSGADKIYGGSGADKLYGNAGADTLWGDAGNDTLYGGAGNDVFVYANGSGNDVIADFVTGDKISLSGASVTSASLKSSDMVFKIGSGSLTVKNGKNQEISVGSAIYFNNLTYDSKKTAVTLGSAFSGSLTTSDYYSKTKTINASAVSKAINIAGNAQANSIFGGNGADTISGGKGNDILTGGAGSDTFVFGSGDGKDTITDYAAGDKIKISSGTISKTSYSGNNVVFTIGSGTLTVKDGKGKKITIIDAHNKTITQTYSGAVSGSSAMWFTADDTNFISSEANLDAISAEKYSVTQFRATQPENIFAQEIQPVYSTDKTE